MHAMSSDTGLLGVYYVTELDKIMEAQWVSRRMLCLPCKFMV